MTVVSHEEVGNVRNRNQGLVDLLSCRGEIFYEKWRPVDFSPLQCGLSTIFLRRFTSLLGVTTRHDTRIDKTSNLARQFFQF